MGPDASPSSEVLLLTFYRNYPEAKLQENLDAEIMEVIIEEARDAFDEQIVIELTSNTSEEMEANQERIEQWIKHWKVNNSEA
jgi:adenylate kinase